MNFGCGKWCPQKDTLETARGITTGPKKGKPRDSASEQGKYQDQDNIWNTKKIETGL